MIRHHAAGIPRTVTRRSFASERALLGPRLSLAPNAPSSGPPGHCWPACRCHPRAGRRAAPRKLPMDL